jgi:hypothetical protein
MDPIFVDISANVSLFQRYRQIAGRLSRWKPKTPDDIGMVISTLSDES